MIEQIKALSWKGWGIITAIVVLILGLPSFLYHILDIGESISAFSPWENAVGISTEESIQAFRSPKPEADTHLAYRLKALVGILIYYIVGPGLLIAFGIRPSSESSKRANKPSMLFQTGMALTIAGLLNLGLDAGITPIIQQNTRQSAAVSAQKDQMRQEMLELGLASYEYFVMPDSLGGGGGSFVGISKLKIADALEFQTDAYELHPVSDTLLKISGRKAVPQPQPEKDSTRLVLHVHPSPILDWQDSK